METMLPTPELDPAFLQPGTQLGPWRVKGWRGQGAYGTVYRVERVGDEEAGPFALKLALQPGDERFEREAELLSRISHPHVPRLFEEGSWQHRDGAFPYLVMQWIEGVPLYTWASQRNPSSRQVLTLLAQLARALEATDEVDGVHRDVKGDNVLVRLADGSPFLTDYGAGNVRGAPTLTRRALPPGTPAYRSPEAWAFERLFWRHPTAHYDASACDDLFALGVTAYRLVTDEYPPPTCPDEVGADVWQADGPGPRAPRVLNPNVCPELDALILCLLAVNPSERFRGQPRKAAEALEQAARDVGPEADALLFASETQPISPWPVKDVSSGKQWGHRLRRRDLEVVRRFEEHDAAARAKQDRREAEERKWKSASSQRARGEALAALPWLVVPVLGLGIIAVSAQWQGHLVQGAAHERKYGALAGGARGGGSVAAGDGALSMQVTVASPESQWAGFRLNMPKAPFPGQRRPPCKPVFEVEIRGGCWIPHRDLKPPCNDETYQWEGGCYMPSHPPLRPTTAEEHQNP